MKRVAWLFNESEPLATKPAPFSQLRSFHFSILIRARSICAIPPLRNLDSFDTKKRLLVGTRLGYVRVLV